MGEGRAVTDLSGGGPDLLTSKDAIIDEFGVLQDAGNHSQYFASASNEVAL